MTGMNECPVCDIKIEASGPHITIMQFGKTNGDVDVVARFCTMDHLEQWAAEMRGFHHTPGATL